MYVARVPNRGSPPAVLLRESYREAGKVKNRTLANLSSWPEAKVDALSRVLKGQLAPAAKPKIMRETAVMTLIDAQRTFGQVSALFATDAAVAKRGKRIEWNGMDVIPFEDGKVKRKDVYSDSVSILRQVGLL